MITIIKIYSLLGELYLQGKYKNTTVKLGRQILDTPFADSDDIGMVPNLFEAYTFTSSDFSDTLLFFSHIVKMAGVDAVEPGHFSRLNGSRALQTLGIVYEGLYETTLEGWFYHMAHSVDVGYFAVNRTQKYSRGDYSVGVQYAIQDYRSGEKAAIGGITGEISDKKSGLILSASYNKTDSDGAVAADNFFGGGPFYTSCEHLTIAEAGTDGRALRLGIAYDAAGLGFDHMVISVSKLHLDGEDADADEIDFALHYDFKEKLTFDLIYSDATDHVNSDNSFQNFRFFANYSF